MHTLSKPISAVAALLASGVASAQTRDDLSALSTRFDRPAALAEWRQHRVDGFSAKWDEPAVENGRLVLRPTSSGWFEDMQAGHLYRPVDGNFIVTVRIRVEGTRAQLPQTLFSLAGVFVRAPIEGLTAKTWQPSRENWLFFSLGSAFPAGAPQFEVKTTFNSLSTLKIKDAAAVYADGRTRWVDLRVARQGELFTLLYRIEGETRFTELEQFIRPDLPRVLNVGVTAYSDWGSAERIYPDFRRYNIEPPARNADLVAFVESIEFRRPTVDRFPIATLDPAVSFNREVSERRAADLLQ